MDFVAFKVLVDLDDYLFEVFAHDDLASLITEKSVNVKINEKDITLELERITKIEKTTSNLA